MMLRSTVLTASHYADELIDLFGDLDICINSLKVIVDRSLPGTAVWNFETGIILSSGGINLTASDAEALIERCIGKLADMFYR